MKIIISESKLRRIILEEYQRLLEDPATQAASKAAVGGSKIAKEIMRKTPGALKDAGVDVAGNMDPTELEPLHGLAMAME